jgi:hypothetical protein
MDEPFTGSDIPPGADDSRPNDFNAERETYSIREPGSEGDSDADGEISQPPAEFILRDHSDSDLPKPNTGRDYRLYLPKHSGWVAAIKQSWEQEHCYAKNPDEDWFHLLANGEIFIQRGAEKFCLTCALRLKILTRNRLFWQKGSSQAEDE